mmetsp:Transcript_68637/g.173538  ORF Transcript_68637/g.173538 Transcript_68637/m.173538 type:complete len:807 (+) Transcript_68637:2-2422(+)
MMSVEDAPGLCFPAEDRVRFLASLAELQPVWNESRCHRCSTTCSGHAAGCDYVSGHCRCHLGWTGAQCEDQAARLQVVSGQSFQCSRSKTGLAMEECPLEIMLCQAGDVDLAAMDMSALAVFQDCNAGNATSSACSPANGSDLEIEVPAAAKTKVLNSTCVLLAAKVLVQVGRTFEPSKTAMINVGYHPYLPPDVLLVGTVASPIAAGPPLVYPWCLPGGECRQRADEPIQVLIAGREQQCPAGTYALTGSPGCTSCEEGAVSKPGSRVELHDSLEKICRPCGRWSEPNEDREDCEQKWSLIAWVSAASFGLIVGMCLLALHAGLVWGAGCSLGVRGNILLIQDVSTERGATILTTCGRHRLHQRGCRSFPITLQGTGHYLLDSSDVSHLRARVVGSDRLELLDSKGEALNGQYDSSMGKAFLPLSRSLFHTGFLVPTIVLSPTLCLFGFAGLMAAAHLHRVGHAVLWLSLATLPITAFVAWLDKRLKLSTPLHQRLAVYQARLKRECPDPKACDRGPGRALPAKHLVDLWDFFGGLIRERSMYYIEPNIVKPLTAASRLSFAELVGPANVEWFVSHFWGHAFSHTCLALKKHARSVVHSTARSWGDVAYWVCTFSINQYKIPEELAGSDWATSSFYLALRSSTCRGTAMVLDERALPLERSWCLFELLQTLQRSESDSSFEGMLFCTSSGIMNHGGASVEVSLNLGKRVSDLSLENARASSAEDKAMIDGLVIKEMGSFEHINRKLRLHIVDALNHAERSAHKDFATIRASLQGGSGTEHPGEQRPTLLSRIRTSHPLKDQAGGN